MHPSHPTHLLLNNLQGRAAPIHHYQPLQLRGNFIDVSLQSGGAISLDEGGNNSSGRSFSLQQHNLVSSAGITDHPLYRSKDNPGVVGDCKSSPNQKLSATFENANNNNNNYSRSGCREALHAPLCSTMLSVASSVSTRTQTSSSAAFSVTSRGRRSFKEVSVEAPNVFIPPPPSPEKG
eukprot:GDKJ01024445.1.p1 GENE.GDKJ01024445.1~~GDKJ01024445.1.p1  ORF type:complete len:179 (+),score=59.03 GDKJ01024445.1:55-591(+)